MGGSHIIRLSGGYNSKYPGDNNGVSLIVCDACVEKWVGTFKYPPHLTWNDEPPPAESPEHHYGDQVFLNLDSILVTRDEAKDDQFLGGLQYTLEEDVDRIYEKFGPPSWDMYPTCVKIFLYHEEKIALNTQPLSRYRDVYLAYHYLEREDPKTYLMPLEEALVSLHEIR